VPVLREFYGLQPTPPANLFQFVVWEILADGSLPARRDLAWQALKKIPALTPDAMFRASAKALLNAIGITGPYREEKLELIRATVGEFKRHRQTLEAEALKAAGLRRAARALGTLSHLDPDIRTRALLFSAGYPVLTIDEGVSRVVNRLSGEAFEGYVPPPERRREASRARRSARRWLVARVPRHVDAYRDAVLYLRHHAQHTCIAVAPHCTVCPLRGECESVQGGHPAA
jgi:endonuclease III